MNSTVAPAANRVLNGYYGAARRLADCDGIAALPFFMSLRAAIRAMTTASRLDVTKSTVAQSARHYFDFALNLLAPVKAKIIGIGGLSGTGKSLLARGLAPSLSPVPGALVFRSDVERKAFYGVTEYERLPPEAYRREISQAVYGIVIDKAARVARAGHSAIVDAVFATAEERAALETAIAGASVEFCGLFLFADLTTRLQRVGRAHRTLPMRMPRSRASKRNSRPAPSIGNTSMRAARQKKRSPMRSPQSNDSASRHQDCGAVQPTGAQIGERLVGTSERISRGFRLDPHLWHDRKKILAVLPGQIGDRFELALLPKDFVWETWNVAHVDSGADHTAAFAHRAQSRRHKRADRRVNDGAIERFGWSVVRTSGPTGAKLFGESLPGIVTRSGEREYLAPLPARDLGDDMRSGAKPVKPEFFTLPRDLQGAPADQTRTQQRRRGDILAALWQRKNVSRIGDHMRRIATVAGIAGE